MILKLKLSNKLKQGRTFLLVFLMLVLSLVVEAAITFDPRPNGEQFNLTEDELFFYDFNTTCNESFVFFSSNAQDLGFNSFAITNSTGIVNFTPPNNDVGVFSVTIIAENTSNAVDKDVITVIYNVSNSNDAPNITSFWPQETNTSVNENSTLAFNYTATDDDSIYGDVLNTSWYLDLVLVSANLTWNYTPGFCDAGLHNVTLVVNDTSNANDTQSWNVTVNNTNRVPILNYTIQNKTWQEDTNLTNNFTLSNFFSDLDNLECSDESNLTFSAEGNSSITVIINDSTTNVSFITTLNFFGVEIIYFTASDGTNTTNSNNITLNVTGVNDAPTFNYTNQSLFENVPFVFDINATDPDNDLQPGTDTLTYYDNSTIFNINPSTGIISFTPSNSDVGYHHVNISVDDAQINTTALVYFNVTSNSIPNLTAIGNKNATEGIYFRMNVSAVDADNNSLTFSSNFSRFDMFVINSTAVNFSFLPNNDDVGNHTINITVTETSGASDHEVISLNVFNINNAPNLTAIPNQTLRTDKLFTLNVSATDLDNDNLTFYDNSTLFNITYVNITAGLISFTPNSNNTGNHTINISVADQYSNDSQTVLFIINNNTAPVLAKIGNHTFQEDSRFILQINATDADNDLLSFNVNSTLFNFTTVNLTSVLINFTPSQHDVGLHWINFTVNDTPLADFELVFFNITLFNDTPYFDPAIPNLNATVGIPFYYDANATDEENDSLTYSDNSTVFNISNSTGIIEFTPTINQTGNHSTNISVSDGSNINSTIITFTVLAANSAPTITSFTPNTTNISVAEGSSVLFNVTVSDPDGDTINYSWKLNGTEKSTNQSWSYSPGYTEAGYYNVTVLVDDSSLNDSQSWNLTVNNSNRIPKYGVINQSTQSDFSGGTLYQINITAESGNITLAKSDGTNHFAEGNFTSSVIDIQSSSNTTLMNISWKENRPENTSIILQVRSSPDNVTFTNFTGNNTINYTNPNGTLINTSSDRYIQYKAILSTNNSNTTPVIEYVVIKYKISDFAGREDTVYLNYIDLDDYFSDLDTDNTITYTVSNTSNIVISIDSSNRVSLTPDADWYGTKNVTFYASDGYSNVSSDSISLIFQNIAEPSTTTTITVSSGGGGGGGATSYITRNIIINQSRSIELIAPGNVYVGINEEIIVPVTIQNNENYAMQGIELSASSNITGIEMFLTSSYIKNLEPNNKTDVELVIEASNISRSFNVKLVAEVTEPSINDSAIVSINVLENVSKEIAYVRDFIRLNPECLELNELVLQAKKEVENYNYDRARVLLDKAIDNCKFLLSAKKIQVSEPAEFSFYSRILKNPYFKLIMILAIFGILLTIAYTAYNRWKWY